MISVVINRFLIDSFQLLLSQNKSLLEIRDKLVAGGYQSDDIDAVIAQYRSSQSPPATSNQLVSTTTSKIIVIFAVLVILESASLFSHVFTSALIFSVLIKSFLKTNSLVDIFEFNPLFAFTPLVYALFGSLLLFNGFLLLHPSKKAYFSTLFSLILASFSLPAFIYFTALPFNGTPFAAIIPTPSLLSTDTISLGFLFILLLIFTHKFSDDFDTNLPLLAKVIVFPLSLILLFIAGFITLNVLQSKQTSDSSLTYLSSQIHHRIYQLTYLPDNLVRTTKYYSFDQPLLQDYITLRSTYDHSTQDKLKGQPSSALTLDQSATPADFQLSHYITTLPVPQTPETVSLNNPQISQAYYYSSTNSLYFTTTDSTLFLLTSPTKAITKQDLFNIAAGIR